MGSRLKIGIAAGLLLFQLGMIGYARFVPERFFCWAPFDSQSRYAIQVVMPDRALTADEIEARYRIPQQGSDNRAIAHIIKIVQQYEETYGAADRAAVKLSYTVNGRKERAWHWRAH